MIWVAIGLLTAATLAPVAWVLLRDSPVRGRREAALALHRAQLAELDRDLATGQLGATEHGAATLEVQRRLLAAAEAADGPAGSVGWWPVAAVLALVPAAALGLYLVGGRPDLPAAPLAARVAASAAQQTRDDALLAELRRTIAGLDQHSEQARQGYVILGEAEAGRGRFDAAAAAWRHALAIRFDPTLAAEAAEAASEAEGRVSADSAALFRRALATAPPDAPWRPMAEKRLAEAARG